MRLERKNRDRNEYRFYEVVIEPDLFEECSLVICWGRIGSSSRQRIVSSGNSDSMMALAEQVSARKQRRGYLPVST
ncbi:WGR domain-containing protein [Pseudosulfitobacter pseudonitzschiae]|uniref:WGR domain-containing protein n=1 Tax=Pseudosulfitobacter pseudonitzschiae TaxID=1402135 RepID=UPI003B7F5D5A